MIYQCLLVRVTVHVGERRERKEKRENERDSRKSVAGRLVSVEAGKRYRVCGGEMVQRRAITFVSGALLKGTHCSSSESREGERRDVLSSRSSNRSSSCVRGVTSHASFQY